MTSARHAIPVPARLRDRAIGALVPFFVDAATADEIAARSVAAGVLDDYHAATPKELQLATQIIALGFASLGCLSAAMVVKDASLPEMLRLQGHALALDRASKKASKALEVLRKQRAKHPQAMVRESAEWDDTAFRSAIGQALERMTEANARLATFMAACAPKPKLSPLFAEPMTKAVLARRARP
jgi:hypothetical protein